MSRRSRRPRVRQAWYRQRRVVVLLIVLTLVVTQRWWRPVSESPPPESLAEGQYLVQRVVDGDTLLLTNQARVRLLGADTPETVHPNRPVEPWGPEATKFTREFVAQGTVRIQLDRERVDKYGRFLAYVWVGDRMLNEELIRAGLATAETGFRYSHSMKTRFRRAEDEARSTGLGIWSRRPVPAGHL